MNKEKFLSALEKGLGGLPREEAAERINFYSEMIDDLVEEGLTEEEAVAKIGSVGDIVTQILTDDAAPVKPKKARHKPGALEITLLVLGSPIWLALLISAFAVVISIYAVLWSLVASFWSVFASLIGCAAGGVISLVTECIGGNTAGGIAMLGIGYKEMLPYLKGQSSLEEATEKIQRNTRHLAKRQLTWFRRYGTMFWLNLSEYENENAAVEAMLSWLDQRL